VNATAARNASLLIQDRTLNTSLNLHGIDSDDSQKDRQSTWTQYQPVLLANHTYRLTWNTFVTPNNMDLSVYNFPRYRFLVTKLRY